MVERCKQCGADQTKFPLRAQPDKSLVENYKEGTLLWTNLFKMTLQDAAFILIILGMTWAYVHDTEQCKYIVEHPKEVCQKVGAIFPEPIEQNAFLLLPLNQSGGLS